MAISDDGASRVKAQSPHDGVIPGRVDAEDVSWMASYSFEKRGVRMGPMRMVLATIAVALFLLPTATYAQTGSIAGQVRDEQGGALPGVIVEVTSPALIEKVRSTGTDSNGRYQITALPVGTYEVTFKLSSFATVRRPDVVVTSDFTANVVADMKIGGVTEEISVRAEAPVVDVQRGQQQVVFQGSDVRELPTGRNIGDLLTLVPGLSTPRGTCAGGSGNGVIMCDPFLRGFNAHADANDEGGERYRDRHQRESKCSGLWSERSTDEIAVARFQRYRL